MKILFLLTLHFLRNISQNIILYRESNIFHTKRVGPLCCIWNFYFNVVGYYGNITPTSLLLGCVAEKKKHFYNAIFCHTKETTETFHYVYGPLTYYWLYSKRNGLSEGSVIFENMYYKTGNLQQNKYISKTKFFV